MKTIIFIGQDIESEPEKLKTLADCKIVRSFSELATEIAACQKSQVRIFLNCHSSKEAKLEVSDDSQGFLSKADFVRRVFQDSPDVNLEAIFISSCYAGSRILQTTKQGKIVDEEFERGLQEEIDKHQNLKLILCNGNAIHLSIKAHDISYFVALAPEYNAEVSLITPIAQGLLQTVKILTQGKKAVKISTSMLKIKDIAEILREKSADEIKEIYAQYLIDEIDKLDSQKTSKFNHAEVVEQYLSRIIYESFLNKVLINRVDSVATYVGYKDKIKFLDFNYQPQIIFDCDPVFLAVDNKSLEVLQLLATTNCSPNGDLVKYQNYTPLIKACEIGDIDLVMALLNFENIDINKARKDDGATPAHIVCAAGEILILQQLLLRGVRIDIKRKDGSTPLHLACEGAKWDILEELIDGSSDKVEKVVNEVRACDGATALYLLCNHEYKNPPEDEAQEYAQDQQLQFAQSLLFCGAIPTLSAKDGKSPLFAAFRNKNTKLLAALVDDVLKNIDKCNFDELEKAAKDCDCEASGWQSENQDLMTQLARIKEILSQQKAQPSNSVVSKVAQMAASQDDEALLKK